MKHGLLWLLLLLLGGSALAQPTLPTRLIRPPMFNLPPEPLSGWQRRADSLLAPLDKTPVTGTGGTGVLYDRVASLAALAHLKQRCLYRSTGRWSLKLAAPPALG